MTAKRLIFIPYQFSNVNCIFIKNCENKDKLLNTLKCSCLLLNAHFLFYDNDGGKSRMQKLIGLVRRCVEDYQMISTGDRIGVGVSGGKDSLALLVFLAELRKYNHNPFDEIIIARSIHICKKKRRYYLLILALYFI